MAENVVIDVELNIADATKTAQELGKRVEEALGKNKDTKNPRIAKLLMDLENANSKLQKTSEQMRSLAIDPKTGASMSDLTAKVEDYRLKWNSAKAELQDFRHTLASTDATSANILKNIDKFGPEKAMGRYFGKNLPMRETIQTYIELRDATNMAQSSMEHYQRQLDTLEGKTDQITMDKFKNSIKLTEDQINLLLLKLNQVEGQTNTTGKSFRSNFYFVRTIVRDLTRGFNNVDKKLKQFGSKIFGAIKNMTKLGNESKKTTGFLSGGFKTALKNIMRYGFGIRSLYFLFRRLRTYAKDALDEMAKSFPEVNSQMSKAMQSLNQMKGAIGTAIQPLLNVLVPVLEKVAALITKIANLIGGVFALLTGQGKIYQAVAGQTDYAASLDATGSAAKKAKKELEGYLSPIDEINKYNAKQEDSDGAGGGGGAGFTYAEQPISELATKIKDIIDKILEPIKKAWKKVGDFVKSAWTKALKSVKDLVVDIGKDFLEVWNQPETVAIFEDIFRIVGGIGTIIDAIAVKLDIAWKTNENGKRILEGIRDIFGIIIGHIKDAVQYTENWAMQLNFVPLLDHVRSWIESMKPVIDTISGVFEDFYENVILKFTKFVIEDEHGGLPALLQVFEDFNNKVDWEHLRTKLGELWDALEPFAETVAEGLVIFVERISDKLANFVNGENFDKFIDMLIKWMNEVDADEVADGLEKIAKGIIAFEGAKLALNVLSSAIPIIGTFKSVIKWFGSKEASSVPTNISGISNSLMSLGTSLQVFETLSFFKKQVKISDKFNEIIDGFKSGALSADEATQAFKDYARAEEDAELNGSLLMRIFPDLRDWLQTIRDKNRTLADDFNADWTNMDESVETSTINMKTNLSGTVIEMEAEYGTLEKSSKSTAENVKSIFDKDKWILTGIKDGLAESFNSAISSIKNIWNTFADWLNSKLSINIDTSSVFGSKIASFLGTSTLNFGTIPKLASGAVIPPNKEFMAVLGDQRSGTNIETPLSTMVEAFNQALAQNGGGRTEINFLLPNKQKLAQYVIEGGRVLQTSRGRNPFELT